LFFPFYCFYFFKFIVLQKSELQKGISRQARNDGISVKQRDFFRRGGRNPSPHSCHSGLPARQNVARLYRQPDLPVPVQAGRQAEAEKFLFHFCKLV
jgi:hypothetical protein